MKSLPRIRMAILATAAALAAVPAQAQPHIAIGVECEGFQFFGDWTTTHMPTGDSGRGVLFNGPDGATLPAVTAVKIPRAGRYALWARAVDFPDFLPGTRLFRISVDGKLSDTTFGASGKPMHSWESGGWFDLPEGEILLAVHSVPRRPFARADAILLTTDPNFIPTRRLGEAAHPRSPIVEIPFPAEADPLRSTFVADRADPPAASLENEWARIRFLPASRDGIETLRPHIEIRRGDAWVDAGADGSAEAYTAISAAGAEFKHVGFYPAWRGGPARAFALRRGNAEWTTQSAGGMAMWDAGELIRFHPRSAETRGDTVHLDFHPHPAGVFTATWSLAPNTRAPRIELSFAPAAAGEYALGYHIPRRDAPADVEEILQPMMWHRRRIPSRPTTLLQPYAPTPLALSQTAGPVVWGVCGAPEEIPFEWPHHREPRFGLTLLDSVGRVNPSIHGPTIGTPEARRAAGARMTFALRLIVQAGDWYAGFRTAADEVFGWKDYRRNAGVSLTDAALNMIDLVLSDEFGGWWDRARGPYQIETLNGATHASPLTVLSLYLLTGNETLYRRRALPTMEFVLSRDHPHFSPEPDNTGPLYPAGGMTGPVRLYGTSVFGGFWEMTRRRTPVFRDIAMPADGVRRTSGYSHAELFEDWLARHRLTGEPGALDTARRLADEYIENHLTRPPTTELSPKPFFLLSFVPNWEGLLHLYETTGERRYLDGAVFGARQLMTGIWTQPTVPAGDLVVHPNGEYIAASPNHIWWKGPETFRLGYPRVRGDTRERRVSAWLPSNVGLGFEQPSTYRRTDQAGHMIYLSAWAPNFLRLAAHTGDPMFETYARNATLGRWGNYPGYYVAGFTDMPLNPRYPYEGPDISTFYYHHILPHLAWTLDYLVSSAVLRSGGGISFPFERQYGYAWFDSRVYGHAPGRVFDAEGAWLWFDRGVVRLDNPAANYLLAHSGDALHVVLMNEASSSERLSVEFLPEKLGFSDDRPASLTARTAGGESIDATLVDRTATLTLAPRSLVALTLRGVAIDVPTHRIHPEPRPGPHAGTAAAATSLKGVESRGAAIQAAPGAWTAYLWCTAHPSQARSVTFRIHVGGEDIVIEDAEYPFECSLPVADPAAPVRFRIEGIAADGARFESPESVIGAMR